MPRSLRKRLKLKYDYIKSIIKRKDKRRGMKKKINNSVSKRFKVNFEFFIFNFELERLKGAIMAHVKRGMVSRRKHKKLLSLAKGYRQNRSRNVKQAKEAVLHAGPYAFHGRKLRKRNIRALWNLRIGEAVKKEGLSYSVFMHKIKLSKIELDRKILSDLAMSDLTTFKQIVDIAKKV